MERYYKEPIVHHSQSLYQTIVMTKRGEDLRLFLNGNLQFLSLDEHRYHEALVDWPMAVLPKQSDISVLILG